MDNPKIVLIGAGSAQFGYSTLGDIAQSETLKEGKAEIVLHDINPTSMGIVAKNLQDFIDAENLPFTLSATTSRAEALKGADFCIISIEIGNRFELWEQDWKLPLQYGMQQVFGENGGPGGLFHALRITPPILEICGDIEKICPDAFVFNFSNPMSRICTTVNMKFPHLKFIGLCHEIASLEQHLPKILNRSWDSLKVTAGGLNHFSVLLEAVDAQDGTDLYPEIREKAPDYFATLPTWLPEMIASAERSAGEEKPTRPWHERSLFKVILEKFGLLPITTDSHFGEYPGWAWDVVDHEGIVDFYNSYKRFVLSTKPKLEIKLTERVVPVIDGIINDSHYEESAVNIPNDGLIPDFPSFMSIEVPAQVSRSGLRGREIGSILPPGFAGLLYNQVAIHRLTAETILTGSREIALQALLTDQAVNKVQAAEKMLDHMLTLQNRYLGYIK